MNDIFREENYYWCIHCENYSMDIISIDEKYNREFRIYKCALCGENYEEIICLD